MNGLSNSCDVFLLSAGLGTRLRPLTADTPKPLIKVGAKTLIERHLERLSSQGFKRVMINLHYPPGENSLVCGRWKPVGSEGFFFRGAGDP